MNTIVNSIQQIREQAGFTQQELAELVGVTRQTIATWEKGERDIGVAQLARIAKALSVPLELIFGVTADRETTLLFRADNPAVLSPTLRRLLSSRAEDYAEMERLAGELPVLPPSTPSASFEPPLIEDVARGIRDWLGVDDAPLGNVISLLEAKGLKILTHPLPNEVSGFSAYTDAWGGVIVLNRRHALERQFFTALHELAHLIFHRSEYDGPTNLAKRPKDPREQAANRFAGAALLPRHLMEKELRGFKLAWIPEPVLRDMKLKYSVSMRTVLLRAADLGLLSRKRAGQQLGMLTKRYGAYDEPCQLPWDGHSGRGRLERLTYQALLNDEITASRAAEVLAKPLQEVRTELGRYLVDPATEGILA